MTENETILCIVVGAAALFVGYHLGLRKAKAASAQTLNTGDGEGAMAWFTSWGKGL